MEPLSAACCLACLQLGEPNEPRMPPSWNRPEVSLAPSGRSDDLALAARFGLAVAARRDPTQWQLVRSTRTLALCSPDAMGGMHLELDVNSGPLARRLRSSRRDEPLPRAIGLPRRQAPPRVVDATAGLCRDAMVLAQLGCQVVAIESVPALAALAQAAISGSGFEDRLQIVAADSVAWLARLAPGDAPDVVYLDPMFAEGNRAQVKKDMQVCRALAGPPGDPGALFAAARSAARERVVVKRHPDLPPLADGASFAVVGERVRFDVYLQPGQGPGGPLSGSPGQ